MKEGAICAGSRTRTRGRDDKTVLPVKLLYSISCINLCIGGITEREKPGIKSLIGNMIRAGGYKNPAPAVYGENCLYATGDKKGYFEASICEKHLAGITVLRRD